MAFGGPYQYSGVELVRKMGLEARHFDRVSAILKETLEELKTGQRANARQRAEAAQQVGVWLIARRRLAQLETRAAGERLAERE